MTDTELLKNTATRVVDILRKQHGIALTILKGGEPDLVEPNSDIKHHRLRLIPDMRPRRPRKFWDSSWCFYEIGVGRYPKAGRAKVQFFMAGNNTNCGNGAHNRAVADILRAVAAKRPDASYHPISDRSYTWLEIHQVTATPDPVKMADDLVWIVTKTYAALVNLPDAP